MNKIYKKFILSFVAFAIVSTVLLVSIGSGLIHKHLTELKASDMRKTGIKIADELLYKDGKTMQLNSAVARLNAVSAYDEVEIWIVNPYGEVIYSSDETNSVKCGTILKNIYPYKNDSYYGIGTFDGILSKAKLSVIHPMIQNYSTLGYVMLHYEIDELDYRTDNIIRVILLLFSIVSLVAIIIFGVLGIVIIRPIIKVTKAVKEYAGGNLGYEVELKSNDELGLLAAALNDMSSELEKNEEYQKRLIANISHDFRSPLTSIKGYIEAILDGTIPHELQDKYLNTILNEAKRLSGLTDELLELNRVDSNKLHLDIQEVDINRLIRNTVDSFEQRCVQRDITIELIFENEDTIVLADYSRIQQVVYNLLDNAIKFSHNFGKIVIETTKNKDKLMVSIKDNGCGIASDELKNIWDRFYKTDASRGRDKGSSGLGLSIVKEIIQLHNENINVVSTQDAGTTFIFTLTLQEED